MVRVRWNGSIPSGSSSDFVWSVIILRNARQPLRNMSTSDSQYAIISFWKSKTVSCPFLSKITFDIISNEFFFHKYMNMNFDWLIDN